MFFAYLMIWKYIFSILNHSLSDFFIVVKSHLVSKELSLLVEKFHRSKQRLSDFIYT